ncbi:POTRA domain-containing protein, partial [Xenorhabdus koppenhoeferi]|uniref:POTRA domain-containing protein n=1 Tax=Xenorhabdus koppenhoeferi TaxID=351659 RepID=UPI002B413BCF
GHSVFIHIGPEKLTQPYLHCCVTLTELKQLVRAVTNVYITDGYITSHGENAVSGHGRKGFKLAGY